MPIRSGGRLAALLVAGALVAACHSNAGSTQAAAPSPYRAPSPGAYAASTPARAPMAATNDANLDAALASARSTGKPVAILFLASWCGYCKKLEAQTLSNGQVQAELSNFTAMRLDPDGAGRALATRYGVHGFPTVVILDANGNAKKTMVGFEEPPSFIAGLRSAR